MIDTLAKWVASVETTAGNNFEALTKAEKAITDLQALNTTEVDRIEYLENWPRRVNLHIINVPKDSDIEDMMTHISTLLKEVMGN